jgi:hypothetical protein
MTHLSICDKIANLIERIFGIPAHKVERSDDVAIDWGLVGKERDQLETALYDAFPRCAESFQDCRTVEDFARMVAP